MTVECDREDDSRWIADIPALPGVMAYGDTRQEALAQVEALAPPVLADRLEHGEAVPEQASRSRARRTLALFECRLDQETRTRLPETFRDGVDRP